MLETQSVVARLALAAVCGGIIGFQRERKDRPAGFRTHILVSLGSALFMIVSEYNFGVPTDPTRIAAQVVTGIGFLGAGTIIRQGNYIVGLTTAASLWSVAAVGLASGAGYYLAAVAGATMIFFVLSFFKALEDRIVARKPEYSLTVTTESLAATAGSIREILKAQGTEVFSADITRNAGNQAELTYDFKAAAGAAERAAEQISALAGVNRVHWEEAPEVPATLFGHS